MLSCVLLIPSIPKRELEYIQSNKIPRVGRAKRCVRVESKFGSFLLSTGVLKLLFRNSFKVIHLILFLATGILLLNLISSLLTRVNLILTLQDCHIELNTVKLTPTLPTFTMTEPESVEELEETANAGENLNDNPDAVPSTFNETDHETALDSQLKS